MSDTSMCNASACLSALALPHYSISKLELFPCRQRRSKLIQDFARGGRESCTPGLFSSASNTTTHKGKILLLSQPSSTAFEMKGGRLQQTPCDCPCGHESPRLRKMRSAARVSGSCKARERGARGSVMKDGCKRRAREQGGQRR